MSIACIVIDTFFKFSKNTCRMEFVKVSLPNQEIQLKFLSKKTGNCKDSVLTLFGGIGQKDFKMDGEQLKVPKRISLFILI